MEAASFLQCLQQIVLLSWLLQVMALPSSGIQPRARARNLLQDMEDRGDGPTSQRCETLLVIRKNPVKKYLVMWAEFAEKNDDYKRYYEQFGMACSLASIGLHQPYQGAVPLRFNFQVGR